MPAESHARGNRSRSRPGTTYGAAVDTSTSKPSIAAGPSIAATPEPPYVAVIFTSLRAGSGDGRDDGYARMAEAMDELAAQQPGYLGVESAREGLGITVSYWADESAARAWKQVGAHLVAQRRGRDAWYRDYRVRVAVVQRDYGPGDSPLDRLS
jgi:heme-degrading monooxygenase HmoA